MQVSKTALVIPVLAMLMALTGCSTTSEKVAYYEYLKQEAITRATVGVAQANTESIRYAAAAKAVENADASAKAAASVALSLQSKQSKESDTLQPPVVKAPESTSDSLYKWVALILNSTTPLVLEDRRSARAAQVAITQSNNSTSVQKDTNSTMLGLGLGSQAIQAPAPLNFSGAGLTVDKVLPVE